MRQLRLRNRWISRNLLVLDSQLCPSLALAFAHLFASLSLFVSLSRSLALSIFRSLSLSYCLSLFVSLILPLSFLSVSLILPLSLSLSPTLDRALSVFVYPLFIQLSLCVCVCLHHHHHHIVNAPQALLISPLGLSWQVGHVCHTLPDTRTVGLNWAYRTPHTHTHACQSHRPSSAPFSTLTLPIPERVVVPLPLSRERLRLLGQRM